MSSEQEEKEPRMKAFKFAQGHVLCPYCLHHAVPISVDHTGVFYECSCEAWQRAYAETHKTQEQQ